MKHKLKVLLKNLFIYKPLGWWCNLFHRTAYVDEQRQDNSSKWFLIRCKQCRLWRCVKSRNIFTGDPGEIWIGYAGNMTLNG